MDMLTRRVLPLLLLALAGCGSGGGVAIEATSSTRANVEKEKSWPTPPRLLLTIREIHAHVVGAPAEHPPRRDGLEWKTKNGHWRVVTLERPHTIDLLELQETTIRLGHLDLPKGKITQIRLFLDEEGPNEYVRPDGARCPLLIPSADQTGIKIIRPFSVHAKEDEEVRLVIDFNLKESIRKEEGCTYKLSPVFHVRVID
nr:MAG: hypothetical protein DIU72_00035 [Pseudomonadota bacterium]